MFQASNPAFSAEQQVGVLEKIWNKKDCCRDSACTQKVYNKSGGSVENVVEDLPLTRGFIAVGHEFKYTNMSKERLLASHRHALGRGKMKASDVEVRYV